VAKKLYVANLHAGVTQTALQRLFRAYGTVKWATIVTDPATGQSGNFGFVQMSTDAETRAAIAGLNGKSVAGRVIRVREAQSGKKR
jgi:cold-inducible RNA-binding protein